MLPKINQKIQKSRWASYSKAHKIDCLNEETQIGEKNLTMEKYITI